MRRVQIGDLLALAAAIAGRPDALVTALRLCDEAHAAHAYAKRFRRLHPRWGNGSLMSRAFATGLGGRGEWTDEALEGLGVACVALRIWRRRLGLSRRAPMC